MFDHDWSLRSIAELPRSKVSELSACGPHSPTENDISLLQRAATVTALSFLMDLVVVPVVVLQHMLAGLGRCTSGLAYLAGSHQHGQGLP